MTNIIKEVLDKKITYLTINKLKSLEESCKFVDKHAIDGDIIETGCALGGSSIVIAKNKCKKRNFFIYDIFGQIPAPTEKDPKEVHERYETISSGKAAGIDGDTYYGYQHNLLQVVKNNFLEFNIDLYNEKIKFIEGDLRDTLKIENKIALAHIDVDWYEPVKISLEKIYKNLSLYGIIILDDYFDWGGCKKAVDEFLFDKRENLILDTTNQTMKIMKVREK